MKKTIPQAALAVIAEYASTTETHASLDSLFIYAGCDEEPPPGSKAVKALAWLRAVNKNPELEPLTVLGRLIEGYMDKPAGESDWGYAELIQFRAKVTKALGEAGLHYLPGGQISGALAAPTRTLASFIKGRDIRAISDEFERASGKAEKEPREAVSAAANILESICKHYIEDMGLPMPAKQVLGELWGVVRKDLGFDPSQIADDDLRIVLTGMIQVVQGLGAFRTHASSAHGAGPKQYNLEPRHSRLAVHAAHTVALFLLESWDKRAQAQKRN
ncbi:abortive infection family protein [Roseateles sp. PN1]|uniref:abortive infection family protein n=1 Tax=Roseateles sp. PN1 TaxID=3137372 RepID=UPI003138653E